MNYPKIGTRKDQIGYSILAMGSMMLLLLASALEPNPKGFGTHTQIGLSPCGFKEATGLPCPTCGCTTSVALAADGEFLASVATQPFGFFFAIFTGCLCLVSVFGVLTRQPLQPFLSFVFQPPNMIGFSVILLLSWLWVLFSSAV